MAASLALAQFQMDPTNSAVLYVVLFVAVVGAVLFGWRTYVKSKFAAGRRNPPPP